MTWYIGEVDEFTMCCPRVKFSISLAVPGLLNDKNRRKSSILFFKLPENRRPIKIYKYEEEDIHQSGEHI